MATLIYYHGMENTMTGLHVHAGCHPYSQAFVTSPVRSGTYSRRFENRGNDDDTACPPSYWGYGTRNRNELVMDGPKFAFDTEYWVGWSVRFDNNYPIHNGGVILFQIISGSSGGPHIMAQARNDDWEFEYQWRTTATGTTSKKTWRPVKRQRGIWYDCVMRFRMRPSGGGYLEFWLNGTRVVNEQNVQIGKVYSPATDYNMFKVGQYWGNNDTHPRTNLIFITWNDEVRIAQGSDGFSLVDPATNSGGVGTVATPAISPASGTHPTPLSVSMTCDTPDATIRYTTNGSDPTSSSTLYGGPFTLNEGSYNVKAKAFKSGLNDSAIATRTYTVSGSGGTVVGLRFARDTFQGAAGALASHPPDEGSGSWQNAMAYELDGLGELRRTSTTLNTTHLNVTPPGPDYKTFIFGRLGTSGGGTRRLIAAARVSPTFLGYEARLFNDGRLIIYKNGGWRNEVPVANLSFTTTYTVEVKTKNVSGNVEVIASAFSGATLLATTTWTDSEADRVTAANFPGLILGSDGRIVAMEAELLEVLGTVATPVFSVDSGSYAAPLSVTITTSTPDATIRYTEDGTDPTASSTPYTGALTLSPGSHTLKAKAFKNFWADSAIATATYTVTSPGVATPTISPASGTHQAPLVPVVECATADAALHYTTDGGAVSTASKAYNAPPTPVAHWTFDAANITWASATTGTTADSSGNGHTGTLTGMAQATSPVAGKLSGALLFDGSNDYVDIADHVAFDLSASGKYTWAGWIKRSSFSAFATVWAQVNSAGDGLSIYAHTTTNADWGPVTAGVSVGWGNDASNYLNVHSTNNVLTANNFHLVIVTYDGALTQTSRIKIYVDGANVTDTGDIVSVGTIGNIAPTAGNINIGRDGIWNDFFSGTIDELRFYNRLLTAAEINQLFRYEPPSLAAGSYTFNAKGFKAGQDDSSTATRTFTVVTGTVVTPVISPASGSYTAPVTVSITCDTPSAAIYYTLDGFDPTEASTLYTAPFEPGLGAGIVVKAKAFKADMAASLVASEAYTVTQAQVAQPTADPGNGTYPPPLAVTLACPTAGASIHYTTDGTTPVTTSHPLYTAPFELSAGSYTVKARAFKVDMQPSTEVTRTYTVEAATVATPVIFPPPASYEAPLLVQIACDTVDAAIYYTLDNSTPTSGSTPYSTAFVLEDGTHVVKSIAIKSGMTDSAIATANYTVTGLGPSTVLDTFTEVSNTDLNVHTPDIGDAWIGAASDYQVGGGTGQVRPKSTTQTVAINSTVLTADQKVTLTGVIGTGMDFRRLEVYARATLTGGKTGYAARIRPDGVSSAANELRLYRYNAGTETFLATQAAGTISTTTEYRLEIDAVTNGSNNVALVARLYAGETLQASRSVTDTDATNKILVANDGAGFLHFHAVGNGDGYVTTFTADSLGQTPPFGTVADPVFTPAAGTYDNQATASIACATDQATIHYTTDGSTPTTASAVYSAALNITTTTTVKALAVRTDYTDSQVVTAIYTINIVETVATPTIDPNGGTFTDPVNVTLATTTVAANLYYTLDGATPTASSTAYTVPFELTNDVILKVIAIKAGMINSAVATATFNIQLGVVATPTFSPAAGGYDNQVTVSIACATANAVIHYTRDGSTPTAASPAYSAPFEVTATETVKAIGILSPYGNSAVASATYTITVVPTVATPVIDPASGTFTGSKEIAITCATADAAIWYTTDASTPQVSGATSTLYSVPFTITSSTIIKAFAVRAANLDSAVATATIGIVADTGKVATPTATPNGGTHFNSLDVALSCGTDQSTIYYTLDGTAPTALSTEYTVPFTLGLGATTVKAFATRTNYDDSDIATVEFTVLELLPVADPVIDPDGGTYEVSRVVTLTCATAGAGIWYRLDGSDPSGSDDSGDVLYTAPFTLDGSATVTAIAGKSDMLPSNIVSAVFSIRPAAPVITGFETTPKSISIEFDQAIFPASGPGSYQITVNNQVRNDCNCTSSPITVTVLYSNYEYSITMEALSADLLVSTSSNEVVATTGKSPVQVKAEGLTGFD